MGSAEVGGKIEELYKTRHNFGSLVPPKTGQVSCCIKLDTLHYNKHQASWAEVWRCLSLHKCKQGKCLVLDYTVTDLCPFLANSPIIYLRSGC